MVDAGHITVTINILFFVEKNLWLSILSNINPPFSIEEN